MHPFLQSQKPEFQSAIEFLQGELNMLRTGRANPGILENIKLMAYNTPMDIKSLAAINVQDAQTMVVEPWDKTLLQAVEKAIREADIGINPVIDGAIVRVVVPQMTEENRKQLVKRVREKIEESKIKLRAVRESVRDTVLDMEEKNEIAEDEKYKLLEEIDRLTRDFSNQIDSIGEKKEKDIMTV